MDQATRVLSHSRTSQEGEVELGWGNGQPQMVLPQMSGQYAECDIERPVARTGDIFDSRVYMTVSPVTRGKNLAGGVEGGLVMSRTWVLSRAKLIVSGQRR